jgi:hypothetical protein
MAAQTPRRASPMSNDTKTHLTALDTIIEKMNTETSDDIAKRLRAIVTIDNGEGFEGVDVGGASRWVDPPLVGSTADLLYRALWLFKPKAVDFSYTYKCFLFGVVSPCTHFMVGIELFKYEFALSYWCARQEDVGGRQKGIVQGCPGADNGTRCYNPVPNGLKFFAMIRKLLERKWNVYGGNDFAV